MSQLFKHQQSTATYYVKKLLAGLGRRPVNNLWITFKSLLFHI